MVAAVRNNGGASGSVPDPAVDAQLSLQRVPRNGSWWLAAVFWGVQAVFQHVKGVEVATLRLCRWNREECEV